MQILALFQAFLLRTFPPLHLNTEPCSLLSSLALAVLLLCLLLQAKELQRQAARTAELQETVQELELAVRHEELQAALRTQRADEVRVQAAPLSTACR
jgi:hypothetical protein